MKLVSPFFLVDVYPLFGVVIAGFLYGPLGFFLKCLPEVLRKVGSVFFGLTCPRCSP